MIHTFFSDFYNNVIVNSAVSELSKRHSYFSNNSLRVRQWAVQPRSNSSVVASSIAAS